MASEGTAGRRRKGQLLQSVERACKILRLLADERRPMAPTEISRSLGLNLTTCYHLLNTLEFEGFLQRDAARRLRLGQSIGKLHDAFEAMLHPNEMLVELLEVLNERTGETSYLGTWDADAVVSVALREGRGGVHVRGLYLGYREHIYARALGRALLAYRDEQFISSYLERTPLEPLTDRTVVDPDALRRRLAEVVKRGYALEREEFTRGVCCVAAPIFGPGGRAVAAFSVSAPKARFDADGDEIIAAVTELAAAAGERLVEEATRLAPNERSAL